MKPNIYKNIAGHTCQGFVTWILIDCIRRRGKPLEKKRRPHQAPLFVPVGFHHRPRGSPFDLFVPVGCVYVIEMHYMNIGALW